jgi:hypothetical protein
MAEAIVRELLGSARSRSSSSTNLHVAAVKGDWADAGSRPDRPMPEEDGADPRPAQRIDSISQVPGFESLRAYRCRKPAARRSARHRPGRRSDLAAT